jgi:catechol 2,3-dioxygenase-like lactoylglutathione lyase family enzyme
MLDHIGIRTKQLRALTEFYEAVLTPLGYSKLFATEQGSSFGAGSLPCLWIVEMDAPGKSVNIAMRSTTRAGVDAFYEASMASGAVSKGGPQIRGQYHPNHYAAFVVDPDGNNVSAVCHEAS